MKLVLFDDFKLGSLRGDRVVDLSPVVSDVAHHTPQELMSGVIADFDRLRAPIDELVGRAEGVRASEARLRPPLPRPTHLIAMAVNYMEFGERSEPAPINAFIKASSSIIGNGDTIALPPAKAGIFHHEAELGVVIGKEAFKVKAADAYDHIFGYVNFIDASARGLSERGSFYWGKSWDTFGPMGPCVVSADEIDEPQNMRVRLWVNGALRQDFPTSDMAHDIARCVEWCSAIAPLEPGDVIATGTNHQGLGAMQGGDVIEMEIDGLERLTVNVRDESRREWPRGIDQATADRAAGRSTTGGFGEPPRA